MNPTFVRAHIYADLPRCLEPFGLGNARAPFIDDGEDRYVFEHKLDPEAVKANCRTLMDLVLDYRDGDAMQFEFYARSSVIRFTIDSETTYIGPAVTFTRSPTIGQVMKGILTRYQVDEAYEGKYETDDLPEEIFEPIFDYLFSDKQSTYKLSITYEWKPTMAKEDPKIIYKPKDLAEATPLSPEEYPPAPNQRIIPTEQCPIRVTRVFNQEGECFFVVE